MGEVDIRDFGNENLQIPDGMTISQKHYVDEVIEVFKIQVINESNNQFPLHVVLYKNIEYGK